MKRLLLGLLIVTLAGACRRGDRADEPGETASLQTVGGVVIESARDGFTLQTAQGEQIEMELSPEAQIMARGEEVPPAQISEGAAVRASYREEAGRKIVSRVDIDSPAGQAPAPSTIPGGAGMEREPEEATPAR